jgi:hypothetical protein
MYWQHLVVGTNVASEIALVYMPDASLLELTEGAGATTPTNENEDDFTFCVGLATVRNLLYISASDGSLTTGLELRHLGSSDYFSPPALLPLLPFLIEQSTAAQIPATASPSFGSLSKTPASGETVRAYQSLGFGESRIPSLETANTFGRVQTCSAAMGQATMFGQCDLRHAHSGLILLLSVSPSQKEINIQAIHPSYPLRVQRVVELQLLVRITSHAFVKCQGGYATPYYIDANSSIQILDYFIRASNYVHVKLSMIAAATCAVLDHGTVPRCTFYNTVQTGSRSKCASAVSKS